MLSAPPFAVFALLTVLGGTKYLCTHSGCDKGRRGRCAAARMHKSVARCFPAWTCVNMRIRGPPAKVDSLSLRLPALRLRSGLKADSARKDKAHHCQVRGKMALRHREEPFGYGQGKLHDEAIIECAKAICDGNAAGSDAVSEP
jgi:hypothetical protein